MPTTRIYNRLPSDAGVTFEGFKEIKLKSREAVRVKLEDFLEYCKNAKKPAIRVILGEWGEGKTDAYKRYIEPEVRAKGHYAFFVSASTLSNGYESPHLLELLKTTSLSAVRFLTVLFSCIREESGEIKIPRPLEYQDPFTYLNVILDNLVGKAKTRKIFIFIDEFEELLLNPPRLREIISGIKETINGRYSAIDEGGEYEGCVHLIIAATPDAYYRLQVDEETSLIFGGLGRRAGVIELPQIRKQEGIAFLFALLSYSYENNLPKPLPLNNFGIFHALFRITQGNPGNMVSLFTRLMNSAKMNSEAIKVIDGELLLKFLEKEHIFVYGGSTPCLETEALHKFLRIVEDQRTKEIGEKCSLLLRIIVSELKPFSAEELEDRIKYRNIKNLISIINNDIKGKEGIERAILKVSPLREGKTFHDVEVTFKEYISIERGNKFIKIDNYSEPLNDFEDRISCFMITGDNISPKIFLPSERFSIMSFFEGITFDKAIELEHIIKKRLCTDEDYYIASEELLSQIFPSPIPRELEFIRNREERMKLWRDVTKNLAKEYEIYMPTAFIYVLNQSGNFSIVPTGRDPRPNVKFAELSIDMVKINTMFFSINGDVKGSDIEELYRLLKGMKPPIHCVFLLFTGEFTQEAEDKVANKELGRDGENLILEFRLHPTLAKRIICMYKANLIPEGIDKNLLSSIIKKLLIQELDILSKVKSWLNEQESKGIVIREIPVKATSNLREFADTLKFFINFIECESTAEEIFNKNKEELLKFTKYEAKKVGLIPDIEFPKFNRLVEDLCNNGFLSYSRGKYKLKTHPVEKRILKKLEKETKLSEKELEEFFVLKNSRFLTDVFLPILEYKGLIKREANNYLLNDKNELVNDVENDYRRFKRLAEISKYRDYGYIYMIKERGERFISLSEFEAFIDELYMQSQKIVKLNEEVALQKLSLLKRLLKHFIEEFLPLFDKASEKGEEILILTRSSLSNIKDALDEVKNECSKWLKLEFEVENIGEYKEIKKVQENMERYVTFTTKEVRKIIEDLTKEEKDIFFFRKDEKDAYCFNPKLYKMILLQKQSDEIVKQVKEIVEKLDELFQSLNRKREEIKFSLRAETIEEKCKISCYVLRMLEQLNENILPKVQPMTIQTISLRDLLRFVKENMQSIDSKLDSLKVCITLLYELHKSEKVLVDLLEHNKNLSARLLYNFDIGEYYTIAQNFEVALNSIEDEYKGRLKVIVLEDIRSLLDKVKSLRINMEDYIKKVTQEKSFIDTKWKEYTKATEDYISSIKFILEMLRKITNIDKIEEIKAKLNEIQGNIGVKLVNDLKLRLSKLEQLKYDIHVMLYESIRTTLTEKELRLLEFLVEKVRTEKREWLTINELYQFAKDVLLLEPLETEKVVKKFINQGLLKEGVTLAF